MQIRKHKKKFIKSIKYPILLFFIRVFILTVRLFPRKWVLWVFAELGKLTFWVLKKERKKTLDNLSRVYGDKRNSKQLKQMAKKVFVHQALNFADYLHTLHYRTREDFARIMDVEGEEHLEKAYKEEKGVLCLMSHTGSWEFSAITPPVLGYETTAVSKALKNKKINEMIIGYRQKRGMKNISRGKAYPLLIEALQKGECLIIMIDQDTKVKGVFVDFFDKRAYTPIGAAMLALDTGAPVLPMFMKRMPDNRHRFIIKPPLPMVKTGNMEHDLLENTKIYTRAIEECIQETPEQWVWMHERWKTTPEDIARMLEKKKSKEKES